MKKVIETGGYETSEGLVDQITLPNGRFYYTAVNSIFSRSAKRKGWSRKTVEFFGACISTNINEMAHEGYPIQIDGVDIAAFLNEVATLKEIEPFRKQIMQSI